jgi:hypothetical protein
MDSIIDHKKNNQAMSEEEALIEMKGKRVRRMATKGWRLCIQWNDGSTSWECLKDRKESNPVQVVENSIQNSFDAEPAFAWWVPFTMKKRTIIIAKIKRAIY